MNPDWETAHEYLASTHNGPWHWADDGKVIAWHDGTTIAFRQEIQQVLEWLAPGGLPPFGSIVFLFAACRGRFPIITHLLPDAVNLPTRSNLGGSTRVMVGLQVQAVLDSLQSIRRFPQELLSGIRARCVLAEAVFETAHVERQTEAGAVLAQLRDPSFVPGLPQGDRWALSSNLLRQVHLVAEGLKQQSSESLRLRQQTGLDEIPAAPESLDPPIQQARKLIEELGADPELGVLGRTARELMAAVRLPRQLGTNDAQELGGVADIANRGPLDRLLLSELANDDLTLSVRVALNEALYLRREPPAREPPGSLVLLLDSGIRLWGIPRLLAGAVALAVVARNDHTAQVSAWRASGRTVVPVQLLNRDGLVKHLAALETEVHPGAALRAFHEVMAARPTAQSVLITDADTLADATFRQALAASETQPTYIASVDRHGAFALHATPLARRSPICTAQLDLEKLLKPPGRVAVLRESAPPDLPALMGIHPFPFRVPVHGPIRAWCRSTSGETVAITQHRQLVAYKGSFGRMLAAKLPSGDTVWMQADDEVVRMVKAATTQAGARLVTCPAGGGEPLSIGLGSGQEIRAVHRQGNTLLMLRGHMMNAHSLRDGRRLGVMPCPRRWMGGRFFLAETGWHAATWAGDLLRMPRVTFPPEIDPASVLQVFDRDGLGGPWVLTRNARVISIDNGEEISLARSWEGFTDKLSVRISRDGHRLLVLHADFNAGMFVDLQTGERATVHPRDRRWYDLNPAPVFAQVPALRNIRAVAAHPEGLAFRTQGGHWWIPGLSPDNRLVTRGPFPDREVTRPTIAFGRPFRAPNDVCNLRAASWQCGSHVFVDDRGIIHLRSHNPELPEVSLLLLFGESAGWSSDGHACGPEACFERPIRSEPGEVFRRLLEFRAHLRS